jgi:hypothetical protein
MKREYLESKRKKMIEKLKPICEPWGLSFDYLIDEQGGEVLVIQGQKIGVTGNSEEAIIDEVLGYLFVNRYCRHRSGVMPYTAVNAVKRYWR